MPTEVDSIEDFVSGRIQRLLSRLQELRNSGVFTREEALRLAQAFLDAHVDALNEASTFGVSLGAIGDVAQGILRITGRTDLNEMYRLFEDNNPEMLADVLQDVRTSAPEEEQGVVTQLFSYPTGYVLRVRFRRPDRQYGDLRDVPVSSDQARAYPVGTRLSREAIRLMAMTATREAEPVTRSQDLAAPQARRASSDNERLARTFRWMYGRAREDDARETVAVGLAYHTGTRLGKARWALENGSEAVIKVLEEANSPAPKEGPSEPRASVWDFLQDEDP